MNRTLGFTILIWAPTRSQVRYVANPPELPPVRMIFVASFIPKRCSKSSMTTYQFKQRGFQRVPTEGNKHMGMTGNALVPEVKTCDRMCAGARVGGAMIGVDITTVMALGAFMDCVVVSLNAGEACRALNPVEEQVCDT